MKNKLFLLSALVSLSIVFAGCSKQVNPAGGEGDGTGGSLGIKLSFEEAPGALAAGSSAIPVTSWDKSIKSLLLIMTEQAGANEIVKVTRDVAIPTNQTTETQVFRGVEVGTYKVYMVANATVSGAAYGGSMINKGANADASWNKGNLIGKNFKNLRFELKTLTPPVVGDGGAVTGGVNYDSPHEVFVGQAASTVTIGADAQVNATIQLKRAVSLVRVRIDLDQNQGVDFTTATSSLALSRVQKSISAMGSIAGNTTPSITDFIYKGSKFNDNDPTTGYSPLTILSDNYTVWKETIMFPTKDGEFNANDEKPVSAQKIYVKLAGHVPDGYIFLDGTVATGGNAIGYWGANVDVWFHPNQITEINCKLNTTGSGAGEEVIPKEEGDFQVTVSYADWNSNIQETTVEM